MKTRMLAGAAAALCCAGLAMAQPANDNCSGAQAVAIPSTTVGTCEGATVEAGPPQTCVIPYNSTGGVWYTLVGNGHTLDVNTCTGTSFDAEMYVFCSTNADPCSVVTSLSCVGGSDYGCGVLGVEPQVTFCSAAGQTYYILVAPHSTSEIPGPFTLTVADGAPCNTAVACFGTTAGACCYTLTRLCIVTSGPGPCLGHFQGIGTACTYVSPCPGNGACCSSTGDCSITLGASCTGANTFEGDGTACQPSNPCTALLGACCNSTNTTCTTLTQAGCTAAGSTWTGPGTTCLATPCPGMGACCSFFAACWVTTASSCAGATQVFNGAGSTCSPTNSCEALLGACCSSTGACSTLLVVDCDSTRSFLGEGTTCTPNSCTAVIGACCAPAGSCSVTFAPSGTPAGCTAAGSTFQGFGTVCAPNPCGGACCAPNGDCTATTSAAGCAATFMGLGTACSPATFCPIGTPPSNDNCANAIVISSASLPASAMGSNTGAGTEPLQAQCGSSRDVWYRFTPMVTQGYSVTLCSSATTWDTVISVHTACPTATTSFQVGCNDDGCTGGVGLSAITQINLTAGTPYLIRVAGFGTGSATSPGNNGTFTLVIDAVQGRCCADDGTCTVTTQANCTGNWAFGQNCGTGIACGGLQGACCDAATGGCSFLFPAACTGNFLGSGTTCSPNNCPQPSGACCALDGACSIDTIANCTAPRTYLGNDTACQAAPGCPATGSCCAVDRTCSVTFEANCGAPNVWSSGGICVPNTCPAAGSCCVGSCCTVTLEAVCTGTWTSGGVCTTNPCGTPVNDLCADATVISNASLPVTVTGDNCNTDTAPDGPDGTCTAGNTRAVWWSYTPAATASYKINTCGSAFDTVLTAFSGDCGSLVEVGCDDDEPACPSRFSSQIGSVTLNTGQTYLIRVGSFLTETGAITLTIDANNALGSCCAADGSCTSTDAANCTGGFTAGGTCSPNNCPPPTGACCCGSTCSATLAADCTGVNQTFIGAGTVCNAAGSITAPCCLADYNHAGGVSVQDIFDFLAAYFGGDVCADTNGGGLSVQDIFDFLAVYFAGGC